eukprot:CAMPEP_0114599816 /NCGR_PEP_ID=MMETSP0125-20121206/22325_1 /TAXON_ID=485358 ORGANISM="Aristerostoma sp., Strain ATCC 50986" /NCGR_SAMPLE_ID=MMETSP0125 /ASSEMBLY_ACC=CAM_ASM_000245 /LENGTH=84 /DNA_ID=CAMNT_0001807203 /DNA_START=682 /DNA_END=933 /DNA_ORIENTATION=-
MKSHGGFLQGFSSFNYEFAKLYIKFKDLLSKSFEPDNYTDAASIQEEFMSIPTLLNEALNPEKVSISGDTETQIDNFFFEDSCA